MSATLVLAFVLMLLIVAAMAVGVAFGRKPISGSCGGMKALGMDVECEICGDNPALCDTGEGGNPTDLARDATARPVQDRTGR